MIRPLQEKDIAGLKQLHAASGFAWPFPEFGPEMLSALVFVDQDDRPVMLVGARKMAEVFMIADPAWEKPAIRAAALDALYLETSAELKGYGIPEVVAWLPAQVAKKFARRLCRRFGFKENRWTCLIGFVR